MNRMELEALTFGGLDYVPLEKTQLSVRCRNIESSPFDTKEFAITNQGRERWKGIIRFAFGAHQEDEPYFLLPGFLYGTNRGDAPLVTDSRCPRLRKSPTDFPASSWWMVRGDRLTHPVAIGYGGGHVTGVWGDIRFQRHDSWQFAGFGCDIDRGCVYYSLGWENAPWLFINSHTYTPRCVEEEQCIFLAPGETVTVCLHTFDRPAETVDSVHDVIRDGYAMFHQPPRAGADVRTAAELLAQAVDGDAWMPSEQAYAGFVFDRGTHMEYRPLPSTSWTNGVSVAMPMLLAAHRLGNEPMRTHALAVIQRIVDHSLNPLSGLPFTVCSDGKWSNRGWWFDRLPVPGHTGYLVGQTLYGILRAYDAEKTWANVCHEDWLQFVQNVLGRLETTCNSDGEYPYVLSERTGAGICYDSMSGVWCLAAAAYERCISGSREGLEGLLRSEEHYYEQYVAKACCYGGPLDIDKQVDSEGVLAYLRAVRWLHKMTLSETLLNHMKDALLYEFTFKFCYNSPVQTPPLSRGWSSCGGSVTSVANPHIHPMSSSVVDEMLYYLASREDAYIRSRLEDTVGWSLQTFSRYDREYDYGKAGWMSERFCYSQGLLTERYSDGSPASTWFALMPWAVGCILEGLCGDFWDDGIARSQCGA